MLILTDGIIVAHDLEKALSHLVQNPQRGVVVSIIETEGKEFLISDADRAIARAYVATEEEEFIVLVAPRFSVVAQNRLLKILEEPPKNKHFILLTQSNSALLGTIKSRLPIQFFGDQEHQEALELDIEALNLAKLYDFVQEHKHLSHVKAQVLIERIITEAIRSKKYDLNRSGLDLFTQSIRALEVGSPTSFVLTTLLLKLLSMRKK